MVANPFGERWPPWTGACSAVRRPEPVSQERVVREWLAREPGTGSEPPADPDAALDALLAANPGAASFLWRETPIEWYRVDLERAAFESLRPVGGPPDLLWRSVSDDGTLLGVARRRHDAGAGSLEGTGIDVEAIDRYRRALAEGRALDPVVVRTRRGHTPWVVVDGNHRVTAAGLHLLETGTYEPIPAYLAITANPLGPRVRERVWGWIQRLLGRWPARLD